MTIKLRPENEKTMRNHGLQSPREQWQMLALVVVSAWPQRLNTLILCSHGKKAYLPLKELFAIMNNLRTLNTVNEKSLPWYPDYLRYLMFAWSSGRYGGFFRGSSHEGDAIVMDVTMVLVTVTSQLLVRHLCCEYCINNSTLILLSFLLYNRCLFPDPTVSF